MWKAKENTLLRFTLLYVYYLNLRVVKVIGSTVRLRDPFKLTVAYLSNKLSPDITFKENH